MEDVKKLRELYKTNRVVRERVNRFLKGLEDGK